MTKSSDGWDQEAAWSSGQRRFVANKLQNLAQFLVETADLLFDLQTESKPTLVPRPLRTPAAAEQYGYDKNLHEQLEAMIFRERVCQLVRRKA